ncbi:hypothetical protein HNP48_002760 [Acidovorax soli]|uniref:Tsi6 domain-containing protein n=2 Tax=Acidovorax soli TaxID=592050 RepID=A0A7X0PDV3_9BURK|nr:hypothetical protein [Acidovorax soli]
MDEELLRKIDTALAEIRPMAAQAFAPAVSIERQLLWCRHFVLGVPQEDPPGPLSMGLIAVREFDMYGDRPELAALVNEVQRLVQAKIGLR